MATSNWSFSQEFSASFAEDVAALESRIKDAKGSESLPALSAELSRLTKGLADAVGSLPSYDQKGYENRLKSLESSVEALRKASQPVSKFAFKRKAVSRKQESTAQPIVADAPSESTSSDESIVALTGLSNQIVSLDSPTTPKDLNIFKLSNCVVNLLDHTSISAVHVRDVRNTVLLLPPIQSSIMMHDLENTTIVVGCHQFRMHTSHNVDVYLSIPSQPIIEHSSNIRFTGYPTSLACAPEERKSSHLAVQDFSHIKQTPSPNWRQLETIEMVTNWPLSAGLDDVLVACLPRRKRDDLDA